MVIKNPDGRPSWSLASILFICLISGCAQTAASCPPPEPPDLSLMEAYPAAGTLPFQFPLEHRAIFLSRNPFSTGFAKYGMITRGPEYHAAEDILQPAGTPVYAIADGTVSYSGPMNGYGWLVIIDHPQANLYSLYGHLSPSRWQIEAGPVSKGELIGYLGDPHENGGSVTNPMRPHLHFGIRAGQRADYLCAGQWRWQAGWLKLCPQELGWLQPSLVIASQDLQFAEPPEQVDSLVGFLNICWIDLLIAGMFLACGVCVLILSLLVKKPFVLVASSIALIVGGWLFTDKSAVVSRVLIGMAVLFLAIGLYSLIRRLTDRQPTAQDLRSP